MGGKEERRRREREREEGREREGEGEGEGERVEAAARSTPERTLVLHGLQCEGVWFAIRKFHLPVHVEEIDDFSCVITISRSALACHLIMYSVLLFLHICSYCNLMRSDDRHRSMMLNPTD